MIAIITTTEDLTSDIVISWLENSKTPYVRINSNEIIENGNLEFILSNSKSFIRIKKFEIEKVKVVWFRRWDTFSTFEDFKSKKPELKESLKNYVWREYYEMSRLFFRYIYSNAKWIDIPDSISKSFSKINQLEIAKEMGMTIPYTEIVSSKSRLIQIMKKMEIITKPISDLSNLLYENNLFLLYTTKITESDLEKMPDFFFPILIQENIVKTFEIRSFLLENKIYSMAIFSQRNKKTANDFRQYDFSNANRCVPYKLSKDFEQKIFNFAKNVSLTTGSFDFIYDIKKRLVFLEVNPSGQFGMVSQPCNYNIEKIVANELAKMLT